MYPVTAEPPLLDGAVQLTDADATLAVAVTPVGAVAVVIGVIELECHHLFTEDGGQRLLWLAPIEGTDAAEQLAKLGG